MKTTASITSKTVKKPTLYTTLKSSYGDRKALRELELAGYKQDKELSSHNQQVWYNAADNKLLYNVAGTHNLSDWGTDVYLAAGKLKSTSRYKEAKKTLEKAREKYKNAQTTLTGHSLGGSIVGYLASKSRNDKVFTLDKGATIGQKVRKGEQAFRTSGDLVSLLNKNAKHTQTLKNPNVRTGIVPFDVLQAHHVENIQNEKIFI